MPIIKLKEIMKNIEMIIGMKMKAMTEMVVTMSGTTMVEIILMVTMKMMVTMRFMEMMMVMKLKAVMKLVLMMAEVTAIMMRRITITMTLMTWPKKGKPMI